MKSYQTVIVAFLLLVNFTSFAFSQDITLSWDPSPTPEVTGYSVYYNPESEELPFAGTGANEGDSPIDVGYAFNVTLTGLSDNSSYYFAVTARDNFGNESSFSNIVSSTLPTPAVPSVPTDEPTPAIPSVPTDEPTPAIPSVLTDEPAPVIPSVEEATITIALLKPENNALNELIPTIFQWDPVPSGYNVTYTLFYGTDLNEVSSASSIVSLPPSSGSPRIPTGLIVILTTCFFMQRVFRSFLPIKTFSPAYGLLLVVLLGGILTACGGGGGGDSSSSRSATNNETPTTESVLYTVNKGGSDYHQAFDLSTSTTYFWKVVATDTQDPNLTYESEVRTFTTEDF